MDIAETQLTSGMRLWYACPAGDEPRPLVIMLHERYGPVEHSFNVIKRAAEAGYVACFPDLFHRYEGPRGPIERSEARYDPSDDQTITDIDETIAFMNAQPFVVSNKIGIVGFWQSGRTPMVYAASGREPSVIGVFHGGIYPRDYEPTFDGQESTASFLPRMNVPLLAGFGELDRLVPLENIRRFRGELEALGKRARIQVFKDTPHGWMNETRPEEYRHQPSEIAWTLMLGFFEQAFTGELDLSASVEFLADESIDFDFSL